MVAVNATNGQLNVTLRPEVKTEHPLIISISGTDCDVNIDTTAGGNRYMTVTTQIAFNQDGTSGTTFIKGQNTSVSLESGDYSITPHTAGDFLCYGNFVGVFGTDRDAYLAVNTDGYMVDGNLVIEDPEAMYDVSGSCEQVGEAADVRISLNGGQEYIGQIYRADDGQVYFEGQQPGTGIRFVFQRQP